ncbi:MAG: T9SS type A sorting domain-containing protein [Lentimicrobium sp.]|nr:T9SS type A sorting domain-containing protein [Lentimicrobium sp.]
MKKLVYLLVCMAGSLFISLSANAQLSHEFDWAKQIMPDGGFVGIIDMAVDNNGNSISTGYFTLNVDFDPGPGVYSLTSASPEEREIFVQKLDPDGNFLWALQFGANSGEVQDVGRGVSTDAYGNIYVIGHFYGIVSFGEFTLTAQAESDDFILKLSPEGTVLWAKQLVSSAVTGWAGFLMIGTDGYIYAAGEFYGTLDVDPGPGEMLLNANGSNSDVYLLRLDPDGNFNWAGSIGGIGSEGCRALFVNVNANGWEMYLGGGFSGTVDFDPGPGVYYLTDADGDPFLLKIMNGQFSWVKNYNVPGVAEIHGLWYHPDGYLYTVKFIGVYNTKTSSEIQKIDPATGNAVWTDLLISPKSTDFIACTDLCMDAAGNLYVKASYRGNIDFDPGPGKYILSNPTTFDGNPVILKLNNAGAFEWVLEFKVYCCSGVGTIRLDPAENLILSGEQGLPIDFDPDPGTFYMEPGNHSSGFFQKLRKVGLPGCQPPTAIQVLNVEQNSASANWINTNAAGSYNLRYRLYGGTEWTTPGNVTSGFILTGLSTGSFYEYQVQGVCDGTPGTWSTCCWFKTIADGCNNPGEPNNTLATATQISVGVPVTGVISFFTDIDWYKFNNTSAQKKINLSLYNLPGPYKMQLVKSSGTLLATSSALADGSESIVYTKGAAGTYYIRVYGNSGHFNQSECYSLLARIYKSSEADPVEEVAAETALKLYPNPAATALNIEFNSNADGFVTMRLFDTTGRQQKRLETRVSEGDNAFVIGLENLPDGLYLFEIVQGVNREIKKVVIHK